jgi:hypothetical protein
MESRDPASSWTLLFLSSTEHVWRHSERKHFFRKLQFALLSSAIELPRLVLTQYVCRMENHAPSLQDHNRRAHDHDAHLHHLKGNQRINNSTSFGFTNPWLLRTAKYRAREYVVTRNMKTAPNQFVSFNLLPFPLWWNPSTSCRILTTKIYFPPNTILIQVMWKDHPINSSTRLDPVPASDDYQAPLPVLKGCWITSKVSKPHQRSSIEILNPNQIRPITQPSAMCY